MHTCMNTYEMHCAQIKPEQAFVPEIEVLISNGLFRAVTLSAASEWLSMQSWRYTLKAETKKNH